MFRNWKKKVKTYYLNLVEGKSKGALQALFSFLLLLLSFIYRFFIKSILLAYQSGVLKSHKPDCRVISVGNITWGGTGKTPLVEILAKFFKRSGRKPAVLIRGYGKDEVDLLKDKLDNVPVLAGRNRIKNATDAKERYQADVIILDDGFQHWRLGRDLDIVLIDARNPFGNSRLIPRGCLREPLSSLSRADAFIITKTNLAKENVKSINHKLRKYNQKAPIYESVHAPRFLYNLRSGEKMELSTIKDQRIAILAGIASPETFTETISDLGAKIVLQFYFPDHYQYSKDDLERIESQCLENKIQTLITTEKDAKRLPAVFKSASLGLQVFTLGIEFQIVKEEQKFFDLVKGENFVRKPFSIVILSDGKAGHLNQSKALAKAIQKRKTEQGMNAEQVYSKIVEIRFKNQLRQALLSFCAIFSSPKCYRCLRCLCFCLKKESYQQLMQTKADIIVSAGSSLSAVSLFLSYKHKARKVILMKPSFLRLDKFDLVIAPVHDRVSPKGNVILTKIIPNLIDQQYLQEQANVLKNRLQITPLRQGFGGQADYTCLPSLEKGRRGLQIKGPTIGVLIGGDTSNYQITCALMKKIISQLKVTVQNFNSQILVTTSRRTPKIIADLLKDNLANFEQCKLLVIANEKNIPEAVGGILGLSDIVLVSGESISMVSEAVSAEKHTLAFIPQKKLKKKNKQERFLEQLEQDGILRIIQPDKLFEEIEKIWRERPKIKRLQDKDSIYQALSKII